MFKKLLTLHTDSHNFPDKLTINCSFPCLTKLKLNSMKRKLLIAILLFVGANTFAQNALKEIISGPKGVSKHFVTLEENNHPSFIPSRARAILGLDPNSDLVLQNVVHDQIGQTHYRFYQTYLNIPVENTMYI